MSDEYVVEYSKKILCNFKKPFKGDMLEKCHYAIYTENFHEWHASYFSTEEYNFDDMCAFDYFAYMHEGGEGPCTLRTSESNELCVLSDHDGTLIKTHKPGEAIHNAYTSYLEYHSLSE
jgi:hypothetical protein